MLGIAAIALAAGCAGSGAANGGSAQSGALEVDPALVRPLETPQPRAANGPADTATAEPVLDIAALKQRLSDTDAIGLFTKLALRNQMDDLLERFRAHYADDPASGVTVLREPYDLLVLKVLALLRDGDPPLARSIARSREALWNILADPRTFALIV